MRASPVARVTFPNTGPGDRRSRCPLSSGVRPTVRRVKLADGKRSRTGTDQCDENTGNEITVYRLDYADGNPGEPDRNNDVAGPGERVAYAASLRPDANVIRSGDIPQTLAQAMTNLRRLAVQPVRGRSGAATSRRRRRRLKTASRPGLGPPASQGTFRDTGAGDSIPTCTLIVLRARPPSPSWLGRCRARGCSPSRSCRCSERRLLCGFRLGRRPGRAGIGRR